VRSVRKSRDKLSPTLVDELKATRPAPSGQQPAPPPNLAPARCVTRAAPWRATWPTASSTWASSGSRRAWCWACCARLAPSRCCGSQTPGAQPRYASTARRAQRDGGAEKERGVCGPRLRMFALGMLACAHARASAHEAAATQPLLPRALAGQQPAGCDGGRGRGVRRGSGSPAGGFAGGGGRARERDAHMAAAATGQHCRAKRRPADGEHAQGCRRGKRRLLLGGSARLPLNHGCTTHRPFRSRTSATRPRLRRCCAALAAEILGRRAATAWLTLTAAARERWLARKPCEACTACTACGRGLPYARHADSRWIFVFVRRHQLFCTVWGGVFLLLLVYNKTRSSWSPFRLREARNEVQAKGCWMARCWALSVAGVPDALCLTNAWWAAQDRARGVVTNSSRGWTQG
jgi:hypothetical protein